MGDKASEIWPNGVEPALGALATAESIGRKGRAIHVWEACPKCGRKRWIKRNSRGTCCQTCMHPPTHYGDDNPRWNASKRTITPSGIRIPITPDDPFFKMAHRCATKGYVVLEHRYLMAKKLGRCLEPWEVVHHIDGDNCNNSLDNLEVLTGRAIHASFTFMQVRLRELESRVTLLEAENALLKTQLSLGQGNPELNAELNC